MARSSDQSGPNRGTKTLGVIGVSVSLAGAACAESSPADAATEPASANNTLMMDFDLHEQEVFDVGMSSFRLFDREDADEAKPETVAQWWGWGCRGCRGCGGCRACRGCRGCGGCRGCRGCGGCRGCRGCAG